MLARVGASWAQVDRAKGQEALAANAGVALADPGKGKGNDKKHEVMDNTGPACGALAAALAAGLAALGRQAPAQPGDLRR